MLSDTERTKLAHWMGWRLVAEREWWKAGNWISHNATWLNPPTGNHMLMLLERAEEKEIDWHIGSRDDGKLCRLSSHPWDRFYSAIESTAPLSVCRAILSMLEGNND